MATVQKGQVLTDAEIAQRKAEIKATETKAGEMLGKAKAALVLEQPFIASLLMNLPMVCSWSIQTMATNGKRYMYNPSFVVNMSQDEVKFVLAHEVMHCVFAHMYRRGNRDHKTWNVAGDYVINNLLITDKIGSMPKGGLHDPSIVARGNNTTDGVYNIVNQEREEGKGGAGVSHGNGETLDDCEDATGTESEIAEQQAETQVRVAQAAQAAKMCGKLSAGMARFAGQALKAVVSWQDVTRRFWTSSAKVEYTFARPKRRFIDQDLYLPTLSGDQLGVVVVFIDCSGSIGPDDLGAFGSEITVLRNDCAPQRLHLVYFDSSVCHHDVFERDDELHIEPHGGGGTAFSPLWKFVEEQGIEPVCGIVLTDLYCNDFGDAPGYPVLWVTTGATEAPFGEVVSMHNHR